MARLPKTYYWLVLLILAVVLAGCELSRNSDDLADPGPVSDVPPTLAPLGAETELVTDATAIPTVIAVQEDTTQPTTAEEQVVAVEPVEPVAEVAQVTEQTGMPVVSSGAETASSVSAESIAPAAGEEASADQIAGPQASIVVDANTSNDLPVGGPVAANPPASQTDPGYTAGYGDGSYTVQSGDTLFSIATRYGTTVQAIVYANGLPSDFIYAGQTLTIPSGDVPAPQYQQPAYQQPTYQQPVYQQPAYQQPYAPTGGENYHLVGPGETLYRIALQYGTSVDAIAGANGIPYPYIIQLGQQLVIPGPGYAGPPPPPPAGGYYEQPYQQGYQPQMPNNNEYYAPQPETYYTNPDLAGTHTVSPGETLFSIAQRYGTTADALAAANGLFNPNQIFVGQVLYLP